MNNLRLWKDGNTEKQQAREERERQNKLKQQLQYENDKDKLEC